MSLTHSQRTRLIRTTRKLSAMLGDTPTIAIADPSTRPSTPTSSNPSRSARTLSPPRINVTLPISSTLSSPTESIQRSPLSPTSGASNRDPILYPSSPTLDDISAEKSIRRRKIAKLAHRFGQNVPPELVTVDSGCGHNDENDGRSERSTIANDDFFDAKSDMDRPPSSASSATVPYENFPPPGLTPPQARLSLNLHSIRVQPSHGYSASVDAYRKPGDRDLAFKQLNIAASSSHLAVNETRRRQHGWSGEWNQGDMEEVQKKLRSLK